MAYMINQEWEILEENFKGNNINIINNKYIKNIPKLNIFKGESCQKILEYYDDIHTFITKLCLLVKLPQSCLSTSMVFFHKHFLYVKCFSDDFEKYLTCTTCIFLSIKVCNQLTPLRELVSLFLKLYIRKNNLSITIDEQMLFETGEKLCTREFEILHNVGFDLNIDLPYKYVHLMKDYYLENLKNANKLIIMTTNFINDSFKLPLCLYYDPILIALASMYLLSVHFRIDFPDTKEGVKWYHVLDRDVSLEEVIEISDKINKIYTFSFDKDGKDGDKINTLGLENGVPVINFSPYSNGYSNEDIKHTNSMIPDDNMSNVDDSESDQTDNDDRYKNHQKIFDTSIPMLDNNGVDV